MIVVGLMSGTSADGTDAAVVDIQGAPPRLQWKLLAHIHQPHPHALREEIFACFRPETGRVDRLCALNFALGRAFGSAALAAIEAAGLVPAQVGLIGSHGQTLWHTPAGPDSSTLQLGEPAVIAEMTGLPVISNFRVRDMAAGGQGAPLVGYVDALLLRADETVRAALNIGGIANVTYLPPLSCVNETAFAFDTGPGNMLIDAAVAHITGGAQTYDRDGALAAQGMVEESLLRELMNEPYFAQHPPKTTGRERFGMQLGEQIWQRAAEIGVNRADLVATLTEFTVQSIAQAFRDFLPNMPEELIVSGGGARNPVLMARLAASLPECRVMTSDTLGIGAEVKEALAFAVLAYESWHKRPGNLPEATGASRPVILGNLTPQPDRISAQPTPTGLQSTEARNPMTAEIDMASTLEMVEIINREDRRVAEAVGEQLPFIAEAIDRIAERMRMGGRLIYIGAGTSGRLGVVDASECPPTFGTPPSLVIALMAGGTKAFTQAVEGVEDDSAAGERDVAGLNVGPLNSVVGLAASGRTPYVLGGFQEARRRGALTVSLACNHPSAVADMADIGIAPVVGPEVIAGSTRMKAGTAQKMVLNLISTGIMIRLGKTFANLMVDVQPTNSKLRVRARRIVAEACGISLEEAGAVYERCGHEVKTAIVAHLAGVGPEEARRRLAVTNGITRQALEGGEHDS